MEPAAEGSMGFSLGLGPNDSHGVALQRQANPTNNRGIDLDATTPQ